MSNVVPFQPKDSILTTTAPIDIDEPNESWLPFSFDIIQTEARGMVLIDACVPAGMATAFLQMLIASQEAAALAI
jgi:hypothetical protein